MGFLPLTFMQELLHSPVDHVRPGGTKERQHGFSGRRNDVEVLIRKIPMSQAYLFSLFPLFYSIKALNSALSVSLAELSFVVILLCFIFMPISLLYWIGQLTTSQPGRLSAVEYHITEVNRNSASVHFDVIC